MLISSILFESKLLNLEQLCLIADKYDDRIKPYIELSLSSQIEQLNLDDLSSLGYTLKAMSAGLWTYFNSKNFEEGILKVINEGGDADTNACVAGSILGAKYGYKSIPEKYINGLINRDILENKYNEYIEQLCKSYERHSKI
jgi:ADP-ribosylglycohydrolase